jgi:hypothetical protein
MSPSWVVAFWTYEEPRAGIGDPESKLKIEKQIVVINDAISVNVSRSKASHIKSASIQLKITDVQYDKELSPNDYVAIWMCRWEDEANAIAQALQSKSTTQLNGFNSGLKFFGKINNVSKNVSISDQGVPDERINVSAAMFDELNMSVYTRRIEETLVNSLSDSQRDNAFLSKLHFLQTLSPDVFLSLIGKEEDAAKNPLKTPDQMIKFFAKVFLGSGVQTTEPVGPKEGVPQNIGNKLIVPTTVFGKIFRSKSNQYLDNIYFYTGIEDYSPGNANSNIKIMSPSSSNFNGGFHSSSVLKGGALMSTASLDNVPLYSIFNQFLNDICNEMFTTMRYREDGGIRPTIVVRQLPFSTPQIQRLLAQHGGITVPPGESGKLAQYKNLPRWVISDSLIKSINVGYGASNQINMVHILNTSFWSDLIGADASLAERIRGNIANAQLALGNIVYDEKDIQKNGLKAFVKETNFESISFSGKEATLSSPFWTAMQADFLFNSSMKLTGKISCFGIQEPICEGDNLELDGIVYHIEAMEHIAQVFASGNKKFMTVLTLSNGILAKALENDQYFDKFYPAIDIPHTYERYGMTEAQEGPKDLMDRLRGKK